MALSNYKIKMDILEIPVEGARLNCICKSNLLSYALKITSTSFGSCVNKCRILAFGSYSLIYYNDSNAVVLLNIVPNRAVSSFQS